MSAWYSKILTTTTTQISNLQSRLLQSDADGDTEDDTHVCRVLRAYYTEQGRVFPPWLPPDPKAPPPVAPVYSNQPAVGSRYGGGLAMQQTNTSTGSGLSSLWGSNSNTQQDTGGGSLRPGRAAVPPSRPSPFSSQGSGGPARSEVQARPLPSQRAGSYQQNNLYGGRDSGGTPPGSSAGGASAQDRLRQKLGGRGTRTTSPQAGTSGPFRPPGGGGGGGSGSYEDRFAPGGSYESGKGDDRPFMAANAPWASNEMEFSGGGLPTGPRRGAGGLPNGPRRR